MRRKLRRIGALALVIAMLLSMFAESLAAAEPQDGASTPSSAYALDPDSHYDAASDNTGKPRLYVDFLGDNAGHNDGQSGFSAPTGILPTRPESFDYSLAADKGGNWDRYDSNQIYYNGKDTIFYVGVGIDRVNLLKALENSTTTVDPETNEEVTTVGDAGGVYSFEAAFYYNPTFVRPYVADDHNDETTDDYAKTIASINLSTGAYANTAAANAHWNGSNYRVVEAHHDLTPQFDGGRADLDGDGLLDEWGELTQEVISNPSNEEIRDGIWSAGGWRMTYVSIEMTAEALEKALKEDSVTPRLDGVYGDETYDGENTTEYLLIIPFVLEQYDNDLDLCLRLVRNATHLTLGAMNGGHINYAAWERVTTRNSESNLKLQTTFTGDLNIFTGEKDDGEYGLTAELILNNGGKAANTADVRVTDDPSPNPAHINLNREVLTGLSEGTGITITVEPQTRYTVTVNVYRYNDGSKTPLATLNPMYVPGAKGVDEPSQFTFIMPDVDVYIEIVFTLDEDAPRNYDLELEEINRFGTEDDVDDSPVGRPIAGVDAEVVGNKTTITAESARATDDPAYPTKIVSKTDSDETDLDKINTKGNPFVPAEAHSIVKLTTNLHSDYYAEIRFTTLEGISLQPKDIPNGAESVSEYNPDTGANEWVLRLYSTGDYTFEMRPTDTTVEVTYVYATHYDVGLEIRHVDVAGVYIPVNPLNRAQLSHVCHDDHNVLEHRYDHVYQDGDAYIDGDGVYVHRPDTKVLVDGNRIGNIYPVPIADTSKTGSISGDEEPATAYDETDDPKIPKVEVETVSVRTGRSVRVAVQASSAYVIDKAVDSLGNTVDRVVVYKADDPNEFFYATKDSNYSNIYNFTMPDYPVRVEVYYTPRTAPQIELRVGDADGETTAVTVDAYVLVENNIHPGSQQIHNNGDVLENAVSGGTVTVKLDTVPDDYTANVVVLNALDRLVPTNPVVTSGLVSGQAVTFTMPNENVTVNVTYVPDDQEEYTAYIYARDFSGGIVSGSDAYFDEGGTHYAFVSKPEGTFLPGRIVVPKGYYIYAVTAVGATTGYPYTLSGNGWSNSRDASVTVELTSNMPAENLYITAILVEGPPEVDPHFSTTLFVKDPDNAGPNYATNYATMKYMDSDDVGDELDERDKVVGYPPDAAKNEVSSDTAYTNAGTVVYVDLTYDSSVYYVKSVTTAPGYLGVGIVWDSATSFHFTTPENSISVTVEYAKIGDTLPPEFSSILTVDKTENGAADSGVNPGNTVSRLDYTSRGTSTSDPAIDIEGVRVHTATVDKRTDVTAAISVADGWYVASVRLVYGGYTRYLTYNAGTGIVEFLMPTVDAKLIVDYREGTRKTGEHTLTLIVDDPDNVIGENQQAYADNYAWADIYAIGSDTVTNTLGEFGRVTENGIMSGSTVAVTGDTVVVSWSTDEGYALDLLAVTADGCTIAPQYVYDVDADTTIATFTMPNADTTILVRFMEGEERLFRADLVIYDPDDPYEMAANRASFADTLSLDVSNDKYVIHNLRGGEGIEVFIEAVDGYYIDSITVTPYSTGVVAKLSGVYGKQKASFNMPAADVQVNVTFLRAWPDLPDDPEDGEDEAKFDVLLTVIDPAMITDRNYGHKYGSALTDANKVVGGESRVPVDRLPDGDTGYIHIHRGTLSYVESVVIYDAAGSEIDWWWSGRYSNTIAYIMPSGDIEVIVTYKTVETEEQLPVYTVTLHAISHNGAAGTALLELVKPELDANGEPQLDSSGNPVTTTDRATGTLAVDGSDTSLADYLTGILTGELLKVTATPADSAQAVSAVYAKTASGEILELYSLREGGASLVTHGGSATFTMPMEHVDVYVVFDTALDEYEAFANLEVAGPGKSGTAELLEWHGDEYIDTTDTVGLNSTGKLSPADSAYIRLGVALGARVDIEPEDGYAIKRVTVVNNLGEPVDFEWILGVDTDYYTEYTNVDSDDDGILDPDLSSLRSPLASIVYKQPTGGSWVKVEFEEIDPDRTYTARVVVNNGGNAGNTAAISMGAVENWVKLIDPAQPNKVVDLKIECMPEYRFEITVVPQSHNIIPTLTDLSNKSQQTQFLMPADDVVVYVRFEYDFRERSSVTMSVYGPSGSTSRAAVSTDFEAAKTAGVGGTVTVHAIENEEWVYVDLYPAAGEYLDSIQIMTVSGTPVLFEITESGRIRFLMADENVEIAVTFDDEEKPTYSVRLYAIAADPNPATNGTAEITLADGRSVSKNAEFSENGSSIELAGGVAAGERIKLTAKLSDAAKADATREFYVDSAYAEYREGPYAGQRIALTVDAATYVLGEYAEISESWFIMQPYHVDVYVRYGVREVGAPAQSDYNVKLQVFGDVGAGSADLSGGTPAIADLAAAPAGSSATTVATAGNQMVLTVTVASGYQIDYISVTPIGTDLDLDANHIVGSSDTTYIFEMPAKDITIQVHLRASTTTPYIATLHVINYGNTPRADDDTADLYYKIGNDEHRTTATDNDIEVPEGQVVDVNVYINNEKYFVLSAYVLREDGTMLRMYGDELVGVGLNTGLPISDPEATGTFTMPASNVDVYITITDLDVPDDWTTAALVATDTNANGDKINQGKRVAEITEESTDDFLYEIDYQANRIYTLSPDTINIGLVWSYGNSHHKAYILEVDGTEKSINVSEGDRSVEPGYAFSPDGVLTSSGVVAPTLNLVSPLPYRYYYVMPADDTITRMHYVETDVTASNLRVEIIDGENPSDNTVTNSVSVNAPGKDQLNLSSVTSAGAWQIIPSVMPGDSVTFVAKPQYEGTIVIASVIDADGEVIPLVLTPNADGTYSGSFEMPSASGGTAPRDTTLRVEFAYSSVTLTLYDYNTANKTVSTLWIPTLEQGITVPVGSTPLMPASTLTSAASEGLNEVMAAAELSDANTGDTTQTLLGIPNNTLTETYVELPSDSTLVGIIGTNENRQELLSSGISGHYDFRTYGESEVTVIVEPENTDKPRYPVVLNLINATDNEKNGASVVNNTSSHYGGAYWTTAYVGDEIEVIFTVDAGRTATVAYTGPAATQIPSGILGTTHTTDQTFTFTVNIGASESIDRIQLDVTYHEPPKLSLAVLDTTGVSGNTAWITLNSAATAQSPSYTSDGSTHNGIVTGSGSEATWSLNVGDLVAVSATPVDGYSSVVGMFYETSAGITDIFSAKTFNMPDEDTTVWVVFGDAEGTIPKPTDPDDPEPDPLYTATLVVDTKNSIDGWAEAGNSLGELLNMTDLSAMGGTLWKTAAEGDEIRGTFTVADGWYAKVEATRSDGTTPISLIRQTTGNAELATIIQPDGNSIITVTFMQTPPELKSHTLSFSIIGHDEQPGNTATLTAKTASGEIKTLAGAAGLADPYTEPFGATVPFGTQLELQAGWADGYCVKKITIERTVNGVTTVYTVAGSEYNNLITAWMSMPDADVTVCVYYAAEYTATLYYEFLNGGLGEAEMYDAANKAGTVVTENGEKIENLSGGETIRTEPTPIGQSRLVGVVYETELTGAHIITGRSDDLDGDGIADAYHDFAMPTEDADVYVVYEPIGGTSHIAAVELEGETAEPGNDAVIENVSRSSSRGTQYWTTAQSGDTIEITVSLAAGYQAKVTAVYPDDNDDLDGSTGELYVTRTLFRLNGEVTSFTMPANSDAIVTIEFIRGYTAELVLKDSSEVSNSAHMTDGTLGSTDGYTLIEANSDASGAVTYTKTLPDGDQQVGVNSIANIGIGTKLDGNVDVRDDDASDNIDNAAKIYRLLFTTAVGGTFNVGDSRLLLDADEAALPREGDIVDWTVSALAAGDPVEDVTITAVVVPKEANPLIAKVQFEGDSDINGNSAYIVDLDTTVSWLTGNIWTTTKAGNLVKTGVDLAPGYTAEVIALNDNIYYAKITELTVSGGYTPEKIIELAREAAKIEFTNGSKLVTINRSGETAIFNMPSDSDVTVIVKFNSEPGPRPYDPRNKGYSYSGTTYLEQGWIYGTNHGEYATITVPTLFTDVLDEAAPDILDDVYRAASSGDAGVSNLFRVSVWVPTENAFVELSTSELIFSPASEPVEDGNYPYNTGNYYPGTTGSGYVSAVTGVAVYNYTGARFNIELAELPAGTTPSAAYAELARILDSTNGSYSTSNPLGTLLEIRAVDSNGRISEPTQLVIPPYYSLEGTIVSYAPMHDATFTLYEYDSINQSYKTEPHTVYKLEQDYGWGKWRQDFSIKSSDFAGRTAETVTEHDLPVLVGAAGATEYAEDATYKLTIEKASVVTYERLSINLEIGENENGDITAIGGYADELTDRSWILARKATVEASDGAAANEVSTMSMVSRGDDAYSGSNDTEPVYGVDNDTEPVYGVDNDTGLIEGVTMAMYSTNEDAAPAAEPVVLVRDIIILITGDVNRDGMVTQTDYNSVYYYINHPSAWTSVLSGMAGWERSTLNPETAQYRADLNGDGWIDNLDTSVIFDHNYNKDVSHYYQPMLLVRELNDYDETTLASYLSSLPDSEDMSDFIPVDQTPTESLPAASDVSDEEDGGSESSDETAAASAPTDVEDDGNDGNESTDEAATALPTFFEEDFAPAPAALPPEDEEEN